MRTLLAVTVLCALSAVAFGEAEEREVTYKVGLDAESIAEVAKVLEQYVDGPLAIYYEGAVKVKFWQPIILLTLGLLTMIVGAISLRISSKEFANWSDWWANNETTEGIIFGVIGLVLAIAATVLLIAGGIYAPQLIAPEYYAIRDIISSIR